MPLRLPDKWVWDFWLVAMAASTTSSTCRRPVRSRRAERAITTPRSGTRSRATSSRGACCPTRSTPGQRAAGTTSRPGRGARSSTTAAGTCSTPGSAASERGLVQRIGLAVSDDLVHWEKHPANPVLEADARWYDLLDEARWRDQSWRDPWLFVDPDDGAFHVPDHRQVSARRARRRGRRRPRPLTRPRPMGGPPAADAAGRVRPGRSAPARSRRRSLPHPGLVSGRRPLERRDRAARHPRRAPGRSSSRPTICSAPTRRAVARSQIPTARSERSTPESSSRAKRADLAFHGLPRRRRPRLRRRADRSAAGPRSTPRAGCARLVPADGSRSSADDGRARDPVAARLGRGVVERVDGLMPLPELREMHPRGARRRAAQAGRRSRSRRSSRPIIACPGAGGEIRVRVFTPVGTGPHPAFLHFHGGGFVFGTIDSVFNDAKCAHICRAARVRRRHRRVPPRA